MKVVTDTAAGEAIVVMWKGFWTRLCFFMLFFLAPANTSDWVAHNRARRRWIRFDKDAAKQNSDAGFSGEGRRRG